MKNIKFNITISYSKLFALITLIAGTISGIWLKSEGIIMLTIPTVAGMIINKQFNDRKNNLKSNENDQ